MKISKIWITVCIGLASLLTGCGGSSGSSGGSGSGGGNNNPVAASSFYKLTQSSNWSYNASYVIKPGTSNEITEPSTISIKIGATTLGNTNVTMTQISTLNGVPSTPSIYNYTMSMDTNGNLLMSNTQNLNTLFVDGVVYQAKFLPAILAVNTTWTVGGTTYKVTNLNGSITTAAGNFTNCLVVTATGTDNYSGSTIDATYYFSATAANLVHVDLTGSSMGGVAFTITTDMTGYTLQ